MCIRAHTGHECRAGVVLQTLLGGRGRQGRRSVFKGILAENGQYNVFSIPEIHCHSMVCCS